MQVFVAVLFVCLAIPTVLCLSEEMQELVDSLHKACVEETGVDEAIIVRVNTEKVMVDDEKLKCYLKCLMSNTGSISDDGVIDVDAVVELMPEEVKADTTPVIRSCGAKIGANPCESAWLTHKCYVETNPAVYMLF